MAKDLLRVACVTMNSTADKRKNIENAEYFIENAVKEGARWVILPELFSYIGPYDTLAENAEEREGPLNERLSKLARHHNITIFAPCPELPNDDNSMSTKGFKKVYNTLYVITPTGSIQYSYRKTHLFHVEFGPTKVSESDGFLPGKELLRFTHEGWRVVCAICYDIRFPELFVSLYKERPFDILIIPSAFTKMTGLAHWELLLRSRSVEFQCFTLGANQTGVHYEKRESYGHSLIVDPWGEVLSRTGAECGLAISDLSRDRLREIRERIPILANRRTDLY